MKHKLFPRFRPFSKTRNRIKNLYTSIENKVNRNIRVELLVTFSICIIIALFSLSLSQVVLSKYNRRAVINYNVGIIEIENRVEHLVTLISNSDFSIKDKDKIEDLINEDYIINSSGIDKVLITDLDGKVIYKSKGAEESTIDIYSIIKNSMSREDSNTVNERKEHVSFYPINFKEDRAYLIVKGIPEGVIEYYSNSGFSALLRFAIAIVVFIFAFLFLTRNKMLYIEEITNGLKEISQGNLNHSVEIRGYDELSSLASNINNMAKDLQNTIQEERRAEETKNQLITNVSHDLRTPLTSIMGFLGLIKERKYDGEEQLTEFVNVAFNKSEKLKVLIEDLFEYTKVSNKVIRLNKKDIVINELLEQLIEEFIPVVEENSLEIFKLIPNEKLILSLDTDKTVRVFDNLLINAIKYSTKPGTITLSLYKKENNIIIEIRNKGENIPKEELPYLFERFYRMDKSRNSENAGSGLGLAISKNIVELQDGKIWAECEGENIAFKVSFPL